MSYANRDSTAGSTSEMESSLRDHLANAGTGHPFLMFDPTMDVTFRFWTATEAVAKADTQEIARFAYQEGESNYRQIDKVDGLWWLRGVPTSPWDASKRPGPTDVPLSALQETLDRVSLGKIQVRSEKRAVIGNSAEDSHELDSGMVSADVSAFRRIQDHFRKIEAALEIANNARLYPAYKQCLDGYGRSKLPHGPIAEIIYAIDAEETERMVAKEDRKASCFDGG